jgi:phage baseplate assembly protein W
MADEQAPHLHVPLTLSGDRLVVDEQDSAAELEACAFAILNTPLGHRIDLPDFGTPDQAHQQGGAQLDELISAVQAWDERIDLLALRDDGTLDDLLARCERIRVSLAESS